MKIRLSMCLFIVGCAASPPVAKTAARDSKGARCLADAAADYAPPPNAPARIEVSHILVRHVELADARGATRSKEAACLRALSALDALRESKMDWKEAVATFSDSPEDSLGRVAFDELNPRFAGAAFALDVDELSYVVETDRGFHVILRNR
jgi:NIMA-interacting peptidyl-prolyl cis-trans isomerase 1